MEGQRSGWRTMSPTSKLPDGTVEFQSVITRGNLIQQATARLADSSGGLVIE